ncbi:DNA-binding MarR family transcriptional regulator [Desulfobaculum xiamenense]|uniref:DNA-binding MarR family transcriptional regulator n=1 Tax=Desulfobaculum xiamenense TaxID=995050 RepID=A0A846QLY9_9BACT|nr:MarR family winged helix-turn-helix transcriptional regulator [Desulfobaculum xiamenense]NJB67233.1 DNA-binding MarR family transcriptional regulator [Desulfobaculum xiamenense]
MNLQKALAIVEAIRHETGVDTMPSQQIAAFLYVAASGGCSMAALAEFLGMAQSTASRTVTTLGPRHATNRGRPGYDLIVAEEDPRERRRKNLRLTPRGKALALRLSAIIDDGDSDGEFALDRLTSLM